MSAPTVRVLDVIELLAQPGNERLRFSDIVRELGLTQATTHAILTTLCGRGWLTRDLKDKTFSLGPALSVVAERADKSRPVVRAARAAVQQLSQEFGYPASVVERAATRWSLRVSRAPPRHSVPASVTAFPTPRPSALRSPRGTPTNNSASGCGAATGNSALTRRLEQVLARTRERGFDVDWTTPALAQAAQLVGALQREGMPAHVREIMDQLVVEYTTIGFLSDDDPARKAQPIATIAAPVFNDLEQVALIICLHPLRALTLRRLNTIGRRLTRATAAISVRSASRLV